VVKILKAAQRHNYVKIFAKHESFQMKYTFNQQQVPEDFFLSLRFPPD